MNERRQVLRVIPWQGQYGLVRGNATVPYKTYDTDYEAQLVADAVNFIIAEVL